MFLRGLECYYFIYIFSFKDVTLCYVAELDAICFVYVCFNFFPNDIGRSCWWPNLVAQVVPIYGETNLGFFIFIYFGI